MLLDEEELKAIKRVARRHGLTVSEWVRRSLREARKAEPERDTATKLEIVRAATEHRFPTADIDQMLREIEQGYVDEPG